MAFCNSCGATLTTGARFFPKCGGAVPVAAAATPVTASPAPAASPQGSGALKIILIVVAVIVVLGILGVGTLAFIVRRIAHNSHIEKRDGNVRVETPFGTVQSTNNPDEASRNLGIELYPGARVLKGNTATIGGMHTVDAEFESDDSAEKVMAFYASKFPNANVTTKDQNRYSIVSTDKKNLITIHIEPEDGKTRITIANVSGKNVTGDNSPD
jgi:tRNA threonylcarbamoyladenosine modification (KEOPS) complex  Pcc1 subunit